MTKKIPKAFPIPFTPKEFIMNNVITENLRASQNNLSFIMKGCHQNKQCKAMNINN